jgi:hypothetical protein
MPNLAVSLTDRNSFLFQQGLKQCSVLGSLYTLTGGNSFLFLQFATMARHKPPLEQGPLDKLLTQDQWNEKAKRYAEAGRSPTEKDKNEDKQDDKGVSETRPLMAMQMVRDAAVAIATLAKECLTCGASGPNCKEDKDNPGNFYCVKYWEEYFAARNEVEVRVLILDSQVTMAATVPAEAEVAQVEQFVQPVVANTQPTTQGSTQKTDPYLKYLGGNFTYRPSKYNENLWKYTCNRYCTPKSKVPNLWADFKKIRAMGEGPAQCCKGVMYVPHLDGVGQWPYFTSTHQCGWEVPRLLLGERDDRTPFNLVQPSNGTGALTSPATRAA